MKLLRVDMDQLLVKWEPVPALYERLGGRALIARLGYCSKKCLPPATPLAHITN